MSVLLRPSLGATLLALASSVSFAQTATSETSEGDGGKASRARLAVCNADVAKLCPDAKGGKRRACLKENTAKLSPECATAYADVEAKAKAMREACADDVKAHCADTGAGKGGQGGVVQCLRSNAAKLSSACSAAVSARFGS